MRKRPNSAILGKAGTKGPGCGAQVLQLPAEFHLFQLDNALRLLIIYQ